MIHCLIISSRFEAPQGRGSNIREIHKDYRLTGTQIEAVKHIVPTKIRQAHTHDANQPTHRSTSPTRARYEPCEKLSCSISETIPDRGQTERWPKEHLPSFCMNTYYRFQTMKASSTLVDPRSLRAGRPLSRFRLNVPLYPLNNAGQQRPERDLTGCIY